jgi:hypothetical protein
MIFNTLKPRGDYMHHIQLLFILGTENIYAHMSVKVNSDYFLKH